MVSRTSLCSVVAQHARERWKLTQREEELLGVLLQGKDNDGIAATLGCRPRTVEAHVTRMLLKSACASRLDLACAAWVGWASASTARAKLPTITRPDGKARVVETTYVPAPIVDRPGRRVGSKS